MIKGAATALSIAALAMLATPVVGEDDTLVGVVRPQDILKYLAEAFPEELLNLPPRPHQLMKKPEGG